MRFNYLSIALSVITYAAVALQSYALTLPNSTSVDVNIKDIERRSTVGSNVYYIAGDLDTIGFSDITCYSGGVGSGCDSSVQGAVSGALSAFVEMLQSEIASGWLSFGKGYQYGGQDGVVAGIYYDIEYGVDISDLEDLAYNMNVDELAASIVSALSDPDLNAIEACNDFTLNGYTFSYSTTLILIGWNGDAYQMTGNEPEDWMTNCQPNN